eukprot:m.9459 g.9459  ORF g.9459 m.9459 type:complete len:391 (+) comp21368_c0_seq2:124-1296(+)
MAKFLSAVNFAVLCMSLAFAARSLLASKCPLPAIQLLIWQEKFVQIRRDLDVTKQSPSTRVTVHEGQSVELKFVLTLNSSIAANAKQRGSVTVTVNGTSLSLPTFCIDEATERGIGIQFGVMQSRYQGVYNFTVQYGNFTVSDLTPVVVLADARIHYLNLRSGDFLRLNCSGNSESTLWFYKNGSYVQTLGKFMSVTFQNGIKNMEYQCGMQDFSERRFIYDIFRIRYIGNLHENSTNASKIIMPTIEHLSTAVEGNAKGTVGSPFHQTQKPENGGTSQTTIIIIAVVVVILVVAVIIISVAVIVSRRNRQALCNCCVHSCVHSCVRSSDISSTTGHVESESKALGEIREIREIRDIVTDNKKEEKHFEEGENTSNENGTPCNVYRTTTA